MELETYKTLFEKSPVPTLYVVSKKVEAANRAAVKLFKRLGSDDLVGAAFGKLWPKGTKASGKPSLTELKALRRGEYGLTLPDGVELEVEVTPVGSKRPARRIVTIEDVTGPKLSAESLEEALGKYRTIFEFSPEAIVLLDRTGNVLDLNDRVYDWLGYKPDEIKGKNITELTFIPAKTKLKLTAVLARRLLGKEISPYEAEFVDINGETRVGRIRAALIRDERGKITADLAMITDVTERARTEEALRRSEEELIASREYTRNIISSSPDMIVSVDNDRRIVEFNEAAEKAFGYSKEEVFGKHSDMLYADLEESKRVSETIRKTGRYIGEITNVRKNGETFPSRLSASLLRDSKGEIVGVVGVSRDITIEKKITEALKESQQRFAALVEAALEGIVIVDAEENIIYTNTAFAETLGYSIEEIIEMNISQLVSAEQLEAILEETEKRKRGETSTYEVEFIHRGGSPVYFMISVSPMFGRDGDYEGSYAVFLDITERKKTEEEKEKLHVEVVTAMNERQALFDGVDVLLWSVRERDDGRLYYEQANAAFAAVEGKTPDYYVGKAVDELHSPEECERIWNSYEWAKLGELRIYETQFGEGADIRYFTIRIIPLREPGGTIRSFIASGMDITDRIHAEEALRESEERYREFTEEAIVGVYIYRDGRFHFVNNEMEAITGYSTDELLEISTDELVSPEDRERMAEREKSRKKGDELPARYSMRIRRKDGEPAVLMVGSRPIQYDGKTAYLGNCIDITERVRAEEASEREHSAFKIIAEAAVDAVDTIDLSRRVLTGLVDALGFDAGTFRLSDYEEGKRFLRLIASFGLKTNEKELSGVTQCFDDPRYVAAFVARSGKPIIAPDVSSEGLLKPFESRLGKFKEKSLISWPVLKTDGDVLGVLHLWSRKGIDISEGDRAFFERLVGMFASVLERKQAEEALTESEKRIRQFAETVPDLLYKWNQRECDYDFLSPAFEKMTGYSLEEIYADPCDFQQKLIHPDDVIRVMKIVNDYAAGGPKDDPLVVETRLVRADGEVIWVRDSMVYEWEDERLSRVIGVMSDITDRKHAEEALSKSEREKSAILENMAEFVVYMDKELSVIWANKTVADTLGATPDVLTGRKCYEMWFGRDRACEDCHALTVFETGERVKRERKLSDGRVFNITCDPVRNDSGEIAGVVEVSSDITERKRNEKALRDTLAKLQKSLYATVSAISKIVETRDPYTSGHQTRVAKLARSIAEEMGLSDRRIELIYMAALVHDIGKISVPQEILSKPTELTELEMNIIRTHPEVGCKILRNIEFPWPITDVVIQHHERLDGSGYPQGLQSEDIMLETRILSVADVVEAMSSHRPYRPELGIDKAIKEIEENKGKLYDTEAVNVCVGLLRNGGFKFDGTQ
ncbi:MAG: PAS domain S-box protein [Candidatus Coatesbacteria bacterium]|nr:MAG: PAS domain S-box protein [Candidatus Coatesbacteria bacterium]